mgnify:CR=1 FL=1
MGGSQLSLKHSFVQKDESRKPSLCEATTGKHRGLLTLLRPCRRARPDGVAPCREVRPAPLAARHIGARIEEQDSRHAFGAGERSVGGLPTVPARDARDHG